MQLVAKLAQRPREDADRVGLHRLPLGAHGVELRLKRGACSGVALDAPLAPGGSALGGGFGHRAYRRNRCCSGKDLYPMRDRTAILRAIGKFSPPLAARQPAIGTFSANSGILNLRLPQKRPPSGAVRAQPQRESPVQRQRPYPVQQAPGESPRSTFRQPRTAGSEASCGASRRCLLSSWLIT